LNKIKHEQTCRHSWVFRYSHTGIDILTACGYNIVSLCDNEEKQTYPFGLKYLGSENDLAVQEVVKARYDYFIGVATIIYYA